MTGAVILLVVLLVAVSAAAVGLTRMLGLFVVCGSSMTPTLQAGELVLGRRLLSRAQPRTGQLVIVTAGASPPVMVKRVLAGPGERLPADISVAESRLPDGRYLLAGDNAQPPLSARWIGPVERGAIWGAAWLVVWPWGRWRRLR